MCVPHSDRCEAMITFHSMGLAKFGPAYGEKVRGLADQAKMLGMSCTSEGKRATADTDEQVWVTSAWSKACSLKHSEVSKLLMCRFVGLDQRFGERSSIRTRLGMNAFAC
jgi:hypothetical protein